MHSGDGIPAAPASSVAWRRRANDPAMIAMTDAVASHVRRRPPSLPLGNLINAEASRDSGCSLASRARARNPAEKRIKGGIKATFAINRKSGRAAIHNPRFSAGFRNADIPRERFSNCCVDSPPFLRSLPRSYPSRFNTAHFSFAASNPFARRDLVRPSVPEIHPRTLFPSAVTLSFAVLQSPWRIRCSRHT